MRLKTEFDKRCFALFRERIDGHESIAADGATTVEFTESGGSQDRRAGPSGHTRGLHHPVCTACVTSKPILAQYFNRHRDSNCRPYRPPYLRWAHPTFREPTPAYPGATRDLRAGTLRKRYYSSGIWLPRKWGDGETRRRAMSENGVTIATARLTIMSAVPHRMLEQRLSGTIRLE
jgi:hypothetical protein